MTAMKTHILVLSLLASACAHGVVLDGLAAKVNDAVITETTSAAVATVPRELIMAAKATYPSDVPNRCSILGRATLRQGRRMAISSFIFAPLGDNMG